MNRNILRAIQLVVLPVMLALGFTHAKAAQPEVKKTTNTMRTYYVQADGKVSARKPETFSKTVRAQNVTHARKILAA